MRYSLFRRLAYSHVLVTLISFLTVGLLLSYLLQQYYVRESSRTLLEAGQRIVGTLEGYARGTKSATELANTMTNEEHNLNARVLVFSSDARLRQELAAYQHLAGDELDTQDQQALARGEAVVKVGRVDFYPGKTISVAVPFRAGGQVAGAVSLHAPFYNLQSTLSEVKRIIWLAAAVAVTLAIILTYWNSWRIAAPLSRVSLAAMELAHGNFRERLRELPPDEVGRLAAAFNCMADELERQETARRELVANVAHELRSPLTSIKGFAQAMLDGTVEEHSFARYLGIIQEEAGRLARLTSDLLDLAQYDAGKLEINKQPVDLVEAVKRTLARMTPQLEAKDLRLHLRESTGRLVVLADPDRLEQVVGNLLDNAIRYSPPGREIRVAVLSADDTATVAVSDQGPGIPAPELPRIWDRFYKVDKSRAEGGTGLGLALVRSLVEANGGEVRVSSTPGQGSTFSFSLPLSPPGVG